VVRRLAGWLLVVFGALGSGLTGMSAAQAAIYSDHLPGAVAAAISWDAMFSSAVAAS
jgi:hypothetical protein